MPFINPKEFKKWGLDKEIENVMQQLTVTSRAESRNKTLSVRFGQRCMDLLNENLLDYATTHYRKRENKTIFQLPKDVFVVPKICKNGVNFHFKRLKL